MLAGYVLCGIGGAIAFIAARKLTLWARLLIATAVVMFLAVILTVYFSRLEDLPVGESTPVNTDNW